MRPRCGDRRQSPGFRASRYYRVPYTALQGAPPARSGDIMRIVEFAELDAIALAGALREGTVSQSEVIEAARSACAALNPSLNAVVEFYAGALELVAVAEVGDFAQRGPLAGVPILRKDIGAAEAGQLQECGSRLLVGHRAARDSAYVELCRRAGMVFVGRRG